MKLVNRSRFPTAEVRILLREALDFLGRKDVGKIRSVTVTDCRGHFQGRAWVSGRRILCRVGPDKLFPLKDHQYHGMTRTAVYDINDAREALLAILVHELVHLSQYHQRKPGSELETEALSRRALDGLRLRRTLLDAEIAVASQKEMDSLAARKSFKAWRRESKNNPAKKLADVLLELGFRETQLKDLETRSRKLRTKISESRRRVRYYEGRVKEKEAADAGDPVGSDAQPQPPAGQPETPPPGGLPGREQASPGRGVSGGLAIEGPG